MAWLEGGGGRAGMGAGCRGVWCGSCAGSINPVSPACHVERAWESPCALPARATGWGRSPQRWVEPPYPVHPSVVPRRGPWLLLAFCVAPCASPQSQAQTEQGTWIWRGRGGWS